MKPVTIRTLNDMKREQRRFVCATAYDASFARIAVDAGIETILVGDSSAWCCRGHDSTIPVTVADMAYHIRCVARAASSALVIGDMPFMSYATQKDLLGNATTLMQAGAHVVKLEGGQWLAPGVAQLSERGIPACGHIGLTPQSVNSFGGFLVQGRGPEDAKRILEDALALEAAGAVLLVIECVPRELAAEITARLAIPVIGIGAGPATDAQVLVMHDLLGMNPRPPRFVRDFLVTGGSIQGAFAAYAQAVRDGSFPQPEHGFD
ncbi:MAG: 3-methyl-2-oxobutanoate hydroxymethyltransferase [Gammaproteobacteria bacterium]|nr:3-methyl-2-oxobutanoate hydroxymethyltransferase [Gammaproteobacteria bacterium]